ncbi:MAG: NAD(P)H-dependent oxidoreductase [Xanthobacteraceae bacterium]
MAPKLHIITASTRPGRIGPSIARWFESYAGSHGAFTPVAVDLAGFNLPVYDEPRHPRMQKYEHAHTRTWAASVAAADAYVFVTPEYNYSPPPSLINALDYVYNEWNYKAGGIVSYGGVSGGLRAAQALKLTLTTLKVVPPPEGVGIPNVAQLVDADGVFKSNDLINAAAGTMLDELARWTSALRSLRSA